MIFFTQIILKSKANTGFHILMKTVQCTPCCPGSREGFLNMASLQQDV